jgi:amino acid adenylation domain-containing protein
MVRMRDPMTGTPNDSTRDAAPPQTAKPRVQTKPRTFLDRFWGQVARVPSHEALADANTSYTYEHLGQRVRTDALRLRSLGVQPGSRIGLLVERNAEALIVLLAILECGAAYVPIDLRIPPDRLRGLLENADLDRVAVSASTRPELLTVIRAHTSSPFLTPEVIANTAPAASVDPTSTLKPTDLAYLIYTSGSTGIPKGVPVSHGNLNHLLTAWDDVMLNSALHPKGATPDNHHRSLLLSSLSFDASVAELFWPLASGGTLVVAPDPTSAALDLPVGELIQAHRITHLQCTPTRATLMLADEQDRTALKSIEHLVIGGEAVPSLLAGELLAAGVQRITNAYGPTEATVWATTCELDARLLESAPAITPIGPPLRNMYLEIFDEAGNPVKGSEVGELVLGGPFVSRGYFRNKPLTQERFGRFDFQGRRLHGYRTGDLVSRRPDGNLDFHGRSDHQVKIRGHRIELGEIEAVLATDTTVQQAAVCVDPSHGGQLVAFIVARGTATPVAEDLQRRLRRRLPEIMVPGHYVVVNDLPKTTSEKVDRPKLTEMLRVQSELLSSSVVTRPTGSGNDSRGPLDLLASDFAIALNLASVAPDDDFFDLGGHSLQVVELLARVESRTGVRVPLRTILGASTPRLLAEHIESLRSSAPRTGAETASGLIVRFRSRAESAPRNLFLVHGAAGNVLRFRPLAHDLRDTVEVIGVQCAGLEGECAPDDSLEAMVLRYADLIENENRGESVELGGYSAGGLVALHLAAELKSRGKTIRSLVLLDSFESNILEPSIPKKLLTATRNARQREGLTIAQFIRGARAGWSRRADWDEAGMVASRAMGYHDLYDHHVRIMQGVRPAPLLDSPALLLRCAIENPLRTRTYNQALRCPKQTTQVWIDCKHDELMTGPSVEPITRAMRTFLRSV